ncbi:MAG: DUF1893 domain-containing protein [Bacilli bacterium]
MVESDISYALRILKEKNESIVIVKDNNILYESKLDGLKAIIHLIDNKVNIEGSSVADKIIGKAAALLLSYLKVKEVYAAVLSEKAIEVLKNNLIIFNYSEMTKNIINRTNTGMCPMEKAVMNINDGLTAYKVIKSIIFSKNN